MIICNTKFIETTLKGLQTRPRTYCVVKRRTNFIFFKNPVFYIQSSAKPMENTMWEKQEELLKKDYEHRVITHKDAKQSHSHGDKQGLK